MQTFSQVFQITATLSDWHNKTFHGGAGYLMHNIHTDASKVENPGLIFSCWLKFYHWIFVFWDKSSHSH